MEDLINAYMKTDYHVFKLNTSIRVNTANAIIDKYLENNNKDSYAFITAWNPQSKSLTTLENIHLNEKLKFDLAEYEFLDGEGKGEDRNWPAEQSYFIPGISKAEATGLAIKYDQKAFIYGEKHKPSQLIICN